jgi:hypothetical protein
METSIVGSVRKQMHRVGNHHCAFWEFVFALAGMLAASVGRLGFQ